jgi:glucan biosynthesis protein C
MQSQIKPERQHYIDALRVISVWVLILFHAAMIFNPSREFQVNNREVSGLMAIFVNGFIYQWHMPLFMLLAGASSWFALRKRTNRQYVHERFTRIFMPYVFGWFIVCVPMMYIGRLQRRQFSGSLWEFYPTFFNTGPLNAGGNFTHEHLWFLLYLFIISLVSLPILRYLASEKARPFISRVADLAQKRLALLFVLPLPIVISQWVLRPFFPNNTMALVDDWAYVAFHFCFFTYGFLLMSDQRFIDAITKNWKLAAVVALGGWGVLRVSWMLIDTRPVLLFLANQAWYVFVTWAFLVALLGAGRIFLNKSSKLLQHTGEIAYPYYIWHNLVVVVLGYFVVQMEASIVVKFLLIVALTTVITWVLAVAIKLTDVTRFLFGLKTSRPLAPAVWKVAYVSIPLVFVMVFVGVYTHHGNPQTEHFPPTDAIALPTETIEQVSGHTYTLSPNGAGWEAFTINLEERPMQLDLVQQGETHHLTVGLNDWSRPQAEGGAAYLGFWRDTETFDVYYDGGEQHEIWEFIFHNDTVNMTILDGRSLFTREAMRGSRAA